MKRSRRARERRQRQRRALFEVRSPNGFLDGRLARWDVVVWRQSR